MAGPVLNITKFSKQASKFLVSRVESGDMTLRDVARKVGCDPSLMTWIKKGHVPTRETTERIGKALGDKDGFLIACGYIPSPDWSPVKDAEKRAGVIVRAAARKLNKARLDIVAEMVASCD